MVLHGVRGRKVKSHDCALASDLVKAGKRRKEPNRLPCAVFLAWLWSATRVNIYY